MLVNHTYLKKLITSLRGADMFNGVAALALRRRQGPPPQEEQGQTTSSLLSSFFRSCPGQLSVLQAFYRSALPVWTADPSERRNHTCH
jgi:hypothetical protein